MAAHTDDLIAYLDASPSPWHAVASTTRRLADFDVLSEHDDWSDLPARGLVVRDGAIIAWAIPEGSPAHTGFHIAGAHTDSPGLRVKPSPDLDTVGWKQLAVEVYGGILNNTWLDRDLGLAGRVVSLNGSDVLVNVAEPIARVPQLAVHLDRGVNDTGLQLDPQRHLTPVWGVGA
ncbi:MAG: M18 family aminopeptidase, partial [Ilumatobacter sp.]|nr:M18 family aminopeptidase [Ilumatobacter sp.]